MLRESADFLSSGLRSLFRENLPSPMLVIVNDRFFGAVRGLMEDSLLDRFRLGSDPVAIRWLFLALEIGGVIAAVPLWVGPMWVWPMWVWPLWVGPLWVGPLWVGPLWVGSLSVGPLWVGPLWVGLLWVGPLSVCSTPF